VGGLVSPIGSSLSQSGMGARSVIADRPRHYVTRDGHLVNRRRVRSPGLAIMIRPGPSRAGAASRRPRTPMPLLLRGADHRFEKSDGHPVSRLRPPLTLPRRLIETTARPFLPHPWHCSRPLSRVPFPLGGSPSPLRASGVRAQRSGRRHNRSSGGRFGPRSSIYAPRTGATLRRLREEAVSG
jgi:hypothetical protein